MYIYQNECIVLIYILIKGFLIEKFVRSANFNSITAISWREQILLLDTCMTLRNKTYLSIKQSNYMYKYKKY
jgi:hypothetical protein